MGPKNISYKTDCIAAYYGTHRCKLADFYKSERWIFEKIAGSGAKMGRVLDIGCAAGGLGRALAASFRIDEYIGVDINPQAIKAAEAGKGTYPLARCRFESGDVLDMKWLPEAGFDTVFSLSCADWNVRTVDIVQKGWRHVAQQGHFVLTLRLTTDKSLFDISESYQYICFEDSVPPYIESFERAPYVVLNIFDALSIFSGLNPKPVKIIAYGYWGKPSGTARTLYERLCFTALAIKKGADDHQAVEIKSELHLPLDIFLPRRMN